MRKPLKIYVAGPYSPVTGDRHDAVRQAHQNTLRTIQLGIRLIKKGHVPFIPHLTHFIHMHSKEPLSPGFYRRYDMVWLQFCDALYFIGPSVGANRELKWAKKHGLKIFVSLSEVPSLTTS